MNRTCWYAGRTYVLNNVCMKIYDRYGRLIQMMSLAEAQHKYPDILARLECPLDISTL